ncbi:hypothetical protein [Alishewanella sp. HL-SH06]|uniref:hypothetical protein n=1 Tax=Alishewanella sp. HL-SH06 TaxID=3461144 RepID=UPI0040431213
MILLNTFPIKQHLRPGLFQQRELMHDINSITAHQKIYADLLKSRGVNNVSIITLLDDVANVKIYADVLDGGELNMSVEEEIIEQLKSAVIEFNNEYNSVLDEKISGSDVSFSPNFKKIFNSLSNLDDVESLKIADESIPLEKFDGTLFRSERALCEAPLQGYGTLEIFDYNDLCIIITPQSDSKQKFQKIKAYCTLEHNIYITKARYSDSLLYGEYVVEEVDGKFHLKSFDLIQMNLGFD